jgi:hypothetical protein
MLAVAFRDALQHAGHCVSAVLHVVSAFGAIGMAGVPTMAR